MIGVVPEFRFTVDVADFLDLVVSSLTCIKFLFYLALCLLQFIEKVRGDCQEITSCKFEDFPSITERGAYISAKYTRKIPMTIVLYPNCL
jgi:hypothetical protein